MYGTKSLILFVPFMVCCCAYNEEPCTSLGGNCLATSSCGRSTSLLSGKCPTQASGIKCCIPYQETACTGLGGSCQRNDLACAGSYVSGKCPTQPANVKCCVSSSPSDCGDKYEETLDEIFGHEGACQNWASDSGNLYQGKIGYTCMGITPRVGWENRAKFPGCAAAFGGHTADFVKFCHDRDQAAFKTGATAIYKAKYFYVCENLAQPAFYVCSDISVNSGPGRSSQFLKELGAVSNYASVKEYAKALNQKHREFYKRIGTGKNAKFLSGWLARADKRDEFIDNYQC